MQTFDDYLYSIYNNRVNVIDDDDPEGLFPCLRLKDLYVLADKLGDKDVANKTTNEIIRFADEVCKVPSDRCVAEAWDELPIESPLCQLFVDYYAYEASMNAIRESIAEDTLPQEFLLKVLDEKSPVLEKLHEGQNLKNFPKNFHVHQQVPLPSAQ